MELIANWLWQGTALAIAATIALHSSKRVSATVRYRLWWLTMLIVLLLPAAPSISLLVQSTLDLDQRSAVAVVAVEQAVAVVVLRIGAERDRVLGEETHWHPTVRAVASRIAEAVRVAAVEHAVAVVVLTIGADFG